MITFVVIGIATASFVAGFGLHAVVAKFVANAEAKAKAEVDALKQSAVKAVEKL